MKTIFLVAVGPKPMNVLREIRNATGLNLSACQGIIKNTPSLILRSSDEASLEKLGESLIALGASVEITDTSISQLGSSPSAEEKKGNDHQITPIDLKKMDVFDEKLNPDFISKPLKNLNTDVWDRGYCCDTIDGTWYEMYVNETIKSYYPAIDLNDEEDRETFGGFSDLFLSNYERYNQITFFVKRNEHDFTLDELTEILI